jgi:hypothetical protein
VNKIKTKIKLKKYKRELKEVRVAVFKNGKKDTIKK